MNATLARTAPYGAIAGIALALIFSPASARPPQPVEKRGFIKAVNRDTRGLEMTVLPEGISLPLVWTPRTRIFQGNQTAGPEALTQGAPVTVWYRTPLFGDRFATKILIETRPSQGGEASSTSGKP